MTRGRHTARTTARRRSGAAALVALTTLTATFAPAHAPVGAAGAACGTTAPPEVTEHPDDWALPNGDPENTRTAGASPIDSETISRLGTAWTYDVPGDALFGNLTTNPVISRGRVYVGALDGSIHVVELADGSPVWSEARDIGIFGPAGVAVGWGLVFGIDDSSVAVAHDAATGEVIWRTDLGVAPGNEIDMAPNLFGDCVLVSTQALAPGSRGTLYALDRTDGHVRWQFETVPDDFWGNPEVNHGGGAWYPPAVDPATGVSYWGTSNPWPSPGAPGFPAGSSRPSDNLYTNSAVALGRDGAMQWYHQVFPHDIWDRDMVLTQVVELADGSQVVTHTGKGGRVLGYDPVTGELLWDIEVGLHLNDDLTTFTEPTTVMPGVLGGVETPPAAADGTMYVSVMNAPTTYDSPEQKFSLNPQLGTHPSHLVAIDAATGAIDWTIDLPGDSLGAVTVVNDLLLTSTFDGTLLAYDRATGAEVWRRATGRMVNGSPAVVGDTIVWPLSGGSPSSLLALRLDATEPTPPTSTTSTTPGTTPGTQQPAPPPRPYAPPATPRPASPRYAG
jgi:outer membrane protein assembly factor BamB